METEDIMSLKELLGDSAWLFELGFPIPRFDVTSSKTGKLDDLSWKLNAKYATPPLETISEQPKNCEYRFAWHERGLMVEVDVHLPNRVKSDDAKSNSAVSMGVPSTLALYIDTRSSPGVHRASNYCHRFVFASPKPTSSKPVLQVDGESLKIPRAKDSPPPIRKEDLPAQVSRISDSSYGWRVFLKSPILHGYDPLEFPEIGLFAEIGDCNFRGSRMLRSAIVPAHEDPSTWCRGKLV